MSHLMIEATFETLYMVTGSTLFSVILGFIPAIILTLTAKDGLKPNPTIYSIFDVLVNIFRSFPFIILILKLEPLKGKTEQLKQGIYGLLYTFRNPRELQITVKRKYNFFPLNFLL